MDSPDPHGAVSNVIKILRKATRIVQLVPFAYLCFYAVYMLLVCFASEETLCLADSLLTISPVATGGMLAASKLFKLCRWHRIACLLPSSSQLEGYIDSYLFTFTQEEILLINSLIGIAALAFLVFAYRHFFAYGK